jgi:hypothetical protein
MEDECEDLQKQQEKLIKLASEAGEICREIMVIFNELSYFILFLLFSF